MSLAIQQRAFLPVWLAMIAVQPSTGRANTEPSRLGASHAFVDLLPPEAANFGAKDAKAAAPVSDRRGATNRWAQREPMVSGHADDGGSAVPFQLPSQIDATMAGLLIVCTGIAAGGLWMLFVHRRPRSCDVSGPVDVDMLKPLIANTLLIIEETLLLPQIARLHGRPVAIERYRLDAAQPLGEPHFPGVSSAVPVEEEAVHWISAAEQDLKQPSYLRHGTGISERALATQEGDRA